MAEEAEAERERFRNAVVKGGLAKFYGIERRPRETDDELADRVRRARDAADRSRRRG